jgi:hypothetical protein
MTKPNDKLDKAIRYLQDNHQLEHASTYGEPGYQDPEKGILFANWNNVPDGLAEWLEKCGYVLEWSDEWCQVYDKAYRTSPDSYHWESQVMLTHDCEYLTPDDLPDWIEECKVDSVNQPVRCLPSWFPTDVIVAQGYELMDAELESGFFQGMDDKPETYIKKYIEESANYVLFQKSEQSQFYSRYFCWVQMPTND